jgi:hypothetical protein
MTSIGQLFHDRPDGCAAYDRPVWRGGKIGVPTSRSACGEYAFAITDGIGPITEPTEP